MRYRVPENVAWVAGAETVPDDPRINASVVPDGETAVLEGVAALVWDVAASGEDVVPEVAALTGQPTDAVAEEVQRFLDDLVALGLLALSGADQEVCR